MSLDVRNKVRCYRCGFIGSTADFLHKRKIHRLCKLCREKELLEKKRKVVEQLMREREREEAIRRAERNRREEILYTPDAAMRAANDRW
jgi:hypothetical protein